LGGALAMPLRDDQRMVCDFCDAEMTRGDVTRVVVEAGRTRWVVEYKCEACGYVRRQSEDPPDK
jgi:RNase P subunit RPR2